jgi:integrase
MATYFKRKNNDGTTSILTIVKVGRFKPTSKSFRTSTKCSLAEARKQAQAWAEPLEEKLKDQGKRGGARTDLTVFTIGDLITEYLGDPTVKALKSYQDYHNLLDWWVANYATEKILDFSVLTLRNARNKLASGGYRKTRSPATVNRYLSALRSAWNWGRSAAGLIPLDRPWPTRLLLTEPAGRTRYLSNDEAARLLTKSEADPAMHTAIIVSITTGIRQGELLRLTWDDIDLDGNNITVLQTKTDTPRAVYLPPVTVEALRKLEGTTSPVPLSQNSLISRWKKIRKAAGLSNFRWHDLRHSCASILAQGGASLPQIGSVLGHKSAAATARYSHLVAGAQVPGHAEMDALLRAK